MYIQGFRSLGASEGTLRDKWPLASETPAACSELGFAHSLLGFDSSRGAGIHSALLLGLCDFSERGHGETAVLVEWRGSEAPVPVLKLLIYHFSENVLSSHTDSSIWSHFSGISGRAVVGSAGRRAFQTWDVSWGSWEALLP